MSLEQRMTAMESAYGKQSDLMRELREAVTVTAELEARQDKLLREHSEWLASHGSSMRAHHAAMQALDERIAALVNGFGEFMRRAS